MLSVLAWATTCWGLVMSLSPLLQVRVVIRRRDSTGASIAWPAVLLVGFVLWLLYGLVIGNVPLIVTTPCPCWSACSPSRCSCGIDARSPDWLPPGQSEREQAGPGRTPPTSG